MGKNKWILTVLGVLVLVLAGFFLFQNAKHAQKHFKGVRIIFFNGGAQGDSFASVVYNGAKAAEGDFGATVEYVWSGWDKEKMALQFKEAIDKSPDAICMMGHPGTNVLAPLIDEAVRKGIIVTLQNVDLPQIRGQYIDKGFGYAGQGLYESGKTLARGVITKFGLEKGLKALVIGPTGITEDGQALNERAMRTKGCVDGLKEGGFTVYVMTFGPAVESNPKENGVDFLAQALARYPDIKVLIADSGTFTDGMEFILKKIGKNPGSIITAGFDLSDGTVQGIKDGYMGVVSDQQPYLQGYLPILQSCLAKKYGFAGLYIDTGVGLIDRSNVDAVAELAKKQIR